MPKKTKKQKVIAQYRKKIKLIQESFPSNLEKSSTITVEKNIVISPPQQELKQKENLFNKERPKLLLVRKYFLADFKRSFVLILLIIVLEIIFYFVSIKNY